MRFSFAFTKSMRWCAALAVCALACVHAGEKKDQQLALVNVSFGFEKYDKVPDIQRRMDETFKARKAELEQRGGELMKRNRELEAEMEAVALEDDFYHVEGDTLTGGFVVTLPGGSQCQR